jgi:hypothetical protein
LTTAPPIGQSAPVMPWTPEQARAMLGKAAEGRRRYVETLRKAKDAANVQPEELTSLIRAVQRALPASLGTPRGVRLTEQLRNLMHAQRLSRTLPRGHDQAGGPAPQLPGPLE